MGRGGETPGWPSRALRPFLGSYPLRLIRG
jgi:hypothetical protein